MHPTPPTYLFQENSNPWNFTNMLNTNLLWLLIFNKSYQNFLQFRNNLFWLSKKARWKPSQYVHHNLNIWFLKLHDIHSLNDVCKYKLGFDWKWYSFVMLQIPEIRVWQTSPWHIPFFWPDISDSSSNTFLGNVSMS